VNCLDSEFIKQNIIIVYSSNPHHIGLYGELIFESENMVYITASTLSVLEQKELDHLQNITLTSPRSIIKKIALYKRDLIIRIISNRLTIDGRDLMSSIYTRGKIRGYIGS